MCSANAEPYSNSNSFDPLFSLESAVTYPFALASRRMSAPNSSSTRMPAWSVAAAQRVPESLVDHLLAVGHRVVLVGRQRRREFEHTGEVGMAMVERQEIQRPAVAEAHGDLPSAWQAGSTRPSG